MMISGSARALRRVTRLWAEASSDAEMHFRGYLQWRDRFRRLGIEHVAGLRVLEIGCGDRAQLSLLFAAAGARVTGLDTLPVALGSRRPRMWLAIARSHGVVSAGRTIVRDGLHTIRYWRRLARLNGHRMPYRKVCLVHGDAAHLPFPDSSFDVVLSSAVWEHLSDVEAATTEVNRVLAPGGIAAIQIALFPALQGGHHPEWHAIGADAARRIRPWDHLYPDRRPLPTYLNEWREAQYRDALGRNLDVIEWQDDELRGSEYLTERVEADLPAFSRRDLLLSAITAWARKRESDAEGA